MIPDFSVYFSALFLFAWASTLTLFYFANDRPKKLLLLLLAWSGLHSLLALNGFYSEAPNALPPRFALVLVPVFLCIGYGLLPAQLRWARANRNLQYSTFLHTVRLPVELCLHALFLYGWVPELMTYAGRNFDILMGITAPIIGWLYWKKKLSDTGLLVWNILGLLLVSFILVNGVLSAELPFQQFAFDQPNRGITYFPFVLLPAVVASIVLYTHLTDLLLLWKLRQ